MIDYHIEQEATETAREYQRLLDAETSRMPSWMRENHMLATKRAYDRMQEAAIARDQAELSEANRRFRWADQERIAEKARKRAFHCVRKPAPLGLDDIDFEY